MPPVGIRWSGVLGRAGKPGQPEFPFDLETALLYASLAPLRHWETIFIGVPLRSGYTTETTVALDFALSQHSPSPGRSWDQPPMETRPARRQILIPSRNSCDSVISLESV